MKTFIALFFLGLFNVCIGRSMESATIEKRFGEAKYAFKIRVTSKSTKECFRGNNAVTTPETKKTTTTTIPSTTEKIQATVANSVPASTRHFTTKAMTEATEAKVSKADTTPPTNRLATGSEKTTHQNVTKTIGMISTDGINLMSPTSVTTTMTESLTNKNSLTSQEKPSQKPTTFTRNQGESTDTTSKENSLKATTASLIEQPQTTDNIQSGQAQQEFVFSTKSVSPTGEKGNPTAEDSKILENTTESMASRPSRRKRSCQMFVYHQDIKILIKQMFKGCEEIRQMKQVKEMNKRFLKSTIRLQMDYSELKPNRNYFFMGRAVPGQHPRDYVFMADELTVVDWKSALKLTKKFKKNNDCAWNGRSQL